MATGASSGESERGAEGSAGFPPLPYLDGAVAGVAAAAIGYLATVLLTATRALDLVEAGPAPTEALGGSKAVGWLFYNAHGVGVRFAGAGGTTVVDFLEAGGGPSPLYLVPPVALLLAGGVTAFRAGETGPGRAATVGATVVAGYAVALVAGRPLLGASLGSYTATPAVPVLPAVGYPLAFGAMGGVAAAVLSTTPAADR